MDKLTTYLELAGLVLIGATFPALFLLVLPLALGLPLALAAGGAYLLACSAVLSGWRPPARAPRPVRPVGQPDPPLDQSKVDRVLSA